MSAIIKPSTVAFVPDERARILRRKMIERDLKRVLQGTINNAQRALDALSLLALDDAGMQSRLKMLYALRAKLCEIRESAVMTAHSADRADGYAGIMIAAESTTPAKKGRKGRSKKR